MNSGIKPYVVKVPFANNNIHLKETINIEDLLNISDPIVSKAVLQITEALKKANLEKQDINMVILAGGSSQLPGVKQKIRELLGIDPCEIPQNLMLAVSYGAALYHREIFNLPKARRDKRILGDTLGILVDDGGRKTRKILLNQSQTIPAHASYKFSIAEGQEIATINLVVMDENTNRNLQQRNLTLSRSAKEIIVDIEVNENRLIILSAYDPENEDEKSIIQCDTSVLTSNDVKKLQQKLGIVVTTGNNKSGLQDCVGIDLGTTTSELTHCNRTGEAGLFALNNPEPVGEKDLAYSKYCFPSVVYYKEGMADIQVANTAAVNAMGSFNECFDTFKIKDRFKPVGEIEGKPVMVQDLSALLLSKIWRSAQSELPVPPSSAVITVPAAFNFDECQDTYNAAIIAGIEKVTLIDEPTAAFYYYKHIQEIDLDGIRNVLVFDFGGGTADVAILDVQEDALANSDEYKDCVYNVLATCGDTHCGGRNVDEMLVNEVCKRFEDHNGCKVSAANMRELRRKVEAAKIALSEAYRENAYE
jgi:Molecular chaperone